MDRVAAGFLAAVDREAAGFRAAGFLAAVDREAAGFRAAVDRDAAGFLAAVDREAVVRERVAAGFAAADDDPGRSSAATRRASASISVRSPFSSSSTLCSATASRPLWIVRSTALRTASTASAAPEPFLSFFFLSFFAMARV